MVKLVTLQHHLDAPLVPLSHYTIFLCPHWYPSATKVSLDVSTGILKPLQYLPMDAGNLESLKYILVAILVPSVITVSPVGTTVTRVSLKYLLVAPLEP